MNYETAHQFLLNQTIASEKNSDALLIRMRQGKPPIPGQITSILLALKVVFEALKDATTIEKEFAYTLYLLAVKSQQLFAAGLKAGVDWPPLLKEDLFRIANATESILSGEWYNVHQ
ncbi:Dethiobiotin synthetase [Rivularia sp. UHCC 0363]|uniref:Dethiobiotin synthetase n=1 Tax=Rivularia sp. UHCC 0363 TaxID=3110244 RepID=UPI002B1F4A98|nr:Dethiobiotin synthetase [Rivularia sp. UHCC 0363]MEA5598684.1 Dethiobiotin synthetase [Rivularia sp. UHCC 0363]